MKFKFDFNLSAWIQNVEIEAASLEEAKEKLGQMSIEDMMDNEGSIKQTDITDLDSELIGARYSVHAYNIKYDAFDLEDTPSLNQITELDLEVDCNEDDLSYSISDEILDLTGAIPESFDYEITSKK